MDETRIIARIRSGGQSGVDRAALDAARAASVPICGWCPADGWAEDLTEAPGLLASYPEMRETPSDDPAERTKWNVRDAEATLIICVGGKAVSPGTLATIEFAKALGKPCMATDGTHPERVLEWLRGVGAGHALTLNVAGPRESQSPGIYDTAFRFVTELLAIDA